MTDAGPPDLAEDPVDGDPGGEWGSGAARAPVHLDRVVVPLGASLVDAAAWVGRSCWIELRLHEVLTSWLFDEDEDDDPLRCILWSVRSRRGELAERWHRRLPELREFPRAGFIEPDEAAQACIDLLSETRPPAGAGRRARLSDVLDEVAGRYRAHVEQAVGPADGPTARTLAEAVAATDLDLTALV